MSEQALFPVFLKLEGRKVLLVGGGAVASAKLLDLVRAGSLVTVVAPEVLPAVLSVAGVIVRQREFIERDLDDVWFVVAAANPEVNRRVAAIAEKRCVFVNAVDDPERASAFPGGVFRRGGVTFAVSTDGHAPALAGLLREALEAAVPDDIESWVIAARDLRQEHRAAGIPMTDRRPLLLRTLNHLYEKKGGPVEVKA